jgi:hypothetical protein
MDDEVGLASRHLIGIENILWSTDFPQLRLGLIPGRSSTASSPMFPTKNGN